MTVKNKNRTKADVKRIEIFGTVQRYEEFCAYWRYLCTRLNPDTVNRAEVQ